MSGVILTPIPWRYVDSDYTKLWFWETEHFVATVTADFNSFGWELADKIQLNQGEPRFLAEGRQGTFEAVERDVREAVGKSYPTVYGYRSYAGALATTFTLATGERIDLGPFEGQRVVVTVRTATGQQKFVGHLRIVHYEVQVDSNSGGPVRLQPSHIMQVASEYGGIAKSVQETEYTGVGRIYRGAITRGCTGRPGFLPNTIDHTGPSCPVHESRGGRSGYVPPLPARPKF